MQVPKDAKAEVNGTPATEHKGKWLSADHVVSSSICSPAVRTVILMVHYSKGETPPMFRDIIPVIAIESRIVETYAKYTLNKDEHSPVESSKSVLMHRNYHLENRTCEIRLVHDNLDMGIDSTHDGNPGFNGQSKVVVCSWPQEDDEKRFAPIFETLEEDVKNKAANA